MTLKLKISSLLIIFIIIIASICIKTAYAQTFIYKTTISKKEFNRKTVISKSDNGYIIKTSKSLNKDESTYSTDLSFAILQWDLHNSEKGADISAKRTENMIFITGQNGDKQINEKIEIDNSPWYQEWGWGLRTYIVSGKDTIRFWSLNSDFQQAMKFEAKKEKQETIELNGRKVESVYVKIRLTGAMKFLWSADMWFRKSDGAFLYSKMKNGLTGPVIIMQLIDERNL